MGKLKNYVMEYAEKNNISFEEAITELGGELWIIKRNAKSNWEQSTILSRRLMMNSVLSDKEIEEWVVLNHDPTSEELRKEFKLLGD